MQNKHFAGAMVAFAVATSFLAGCANTKTPVSAEQAIDNFNRKMSEAEALEKAGNKDGAVRAYQAIANDNPSKAEPWARAAQIHFDQARYGLAIQAADEALKRDPANRQAKSVNAVGGLRLAARSLEELRNDSSLTGDATADAQRLAVLLRETLGTAALLPAADTAARKAPPRRAARPAPVSAAGTPATASATPAATRPASSARADAPAGGGDPFGALK